HLADLDIAVRPFLPDLLLDITEIGAVAQPELHLVTAADRGRQVSPILRRRMTLLGEAFGQIRADRFRGPAELIRQGMLLDPREPEAGSVNLKGQSIGTPEDLEIFDPP